MAQLHFTMLQWTDALIVTPDHASGLPEKGARLEFPVPKEKGNAHLFWEKVGKGVRPLFPKVLAADGTDVAAPATPAAFRAKFERDYAAMENTTRVANISLK